ncbi:MAG: hypothetical protein ACTSX9_05015 [Candidatus Njordarchaeales archaeon]
MTTTFFAGALFQSIIGETERGFAYLALKTVAPALATPAYLLMISMQLGVLLIFSIIYTIHLVTRESYKRRILFLKSSAHGKVKEYQHLRS